MTTQSTLAVALVIAAAAACAVAAADPGGGAFDDGPSAERPDLAPVAPPDAPGNAAGRTLAEGPAPAGPVLAGRGPARARTVTAVEVVAGDQPAAAPAKTSPLRVTVVDADTGAAVPDAIRAQIDRTASIAPGGFEKVPFGAAAPSGFVAWDEPNAWVRMSKYATSLSAVHPLRREVAVRATVAEFDGSVPRGPEVRVSVAGRSVDKPSVADEGGGRLRLLGIPFLRDEPISVEASVKDFEVDPELEEPPGVMEIDDGRIEVLEPAHWVFFPRRSVSWTGRLPDAPWRDLEIGLVLPRPEATSGWGPAFGTAIGCGWGDGDRADRASPKGPKPKGALVVEGRRRDGSPAAGASIYIAWGGRKGEGRGREGALDGEGRGRFEDLSRGPYRVFFWEPGLVFTRVEAEVVEGEERAVTLTEGEGGGIDVVAVDVDGRGLPFATLGVDQRGPEWLDLDGGVQRIDRFTDSLGRRALDHVDPGEVTITASWGSRKGKVVVEAIEGRRTEARIVLE